MALPKTRLVEPLPAPSALAAALMPGGLGAAAPSDRSGLGVLAWPVPDLGARPRRDEATPPLCVAAAPAPAAPVDTAGAGAQSTETAARAVSTPPSPSGVGELGAPPAGGTSDRWREAAHVQKIAGRLPAYRRAVFVEYWRLTRIEGLTRIATLRRLGMSHGTATSYEVLLTGMTAAQRRERLQAQAAQLRAQGLSHQQVADRLGISRHSSWGWERASREGR